MTSCWHQEPAMRPSFKELVSHWEKMLEDSVEYLDLNPRAVHNQAYFALLHALDSPSSTYNMYVQGGKKSLFVAIIGEFYTFDLMEIRVKNLSQN